MRKSRRRAYRRNLGDVGQGCGALVRRAAAASHRQAERDRRAHPQGDPRAAQIPGRCRPRISHARAFLRHAFRRREPAHPARLADRLRPHRRPLRARRALDRPAPARQCAAPGDAETAARPRQHRDRGRARRGRDPLGRLRGRCRPRRRRAWRRDRRPGHARRRDGQSALAHRPVSHRHARDRRARAAAAQRAAACCGSSARAATI